MQQVSDKLKPIGRDASGSEILAEAVKIILNQYPGLYKGEEIKYEELGEESGIAFSNNAGALVYAEKKDVIGVINQTCQYPFFVVYRAAGAARERQKMSIQQFLETLGKWICGEPVEIEGLIHTFRTYPPLTEGRKISRITRDNSYATEPYDNGVQDWILPVSVEYTNKYKIW